MVFFFERRAPRNVTLAPKKEAFVKRESGWLAILLASLLHGGSETPWAFHPVLGISVSLAPAK